MSINEEVLRTLAGAGAPVRFQHYSGEADPYITFFTYLDRPESHGDDRELSTGFYVQVDVWSKTDYTELVQSVYERMLAAGFVKQSFYDLYEEDLKIYHKAMRFLKEV